jgi:FkbM family methyltransferase
MPLREKTPYIGDVRKFKSLSLHDQTEMLWSLITIARKERSAHDWCDFFVFAMTHADKTFAQLCQDLWIIYATRGKQLGFFVDIGAMDGVTLSNTFLLEQDFGWGGIVVEPNPMFSRELMSNRRCRVEKRCVWSRTGLTLPFKQVARAEFSTLQTVDPLDMHEKAGLRNEFRVTEVETISLNDLLEEARAPARIDFLSLDTEGSELEILSVFDFQRWTFERICVEHNFTERRQQIYDLLTRNGYTRVLNSLSQWDDWYVGPGTEVR